MIPDRSPGAHHLASLGYWVLLAACLGLTLWVYWPGQTGIPLLDDRANLGRLDNLAASPQLAREYILGNESGALGRPITMATFVAEKLVFHGDYATSKKVNVWLHLFNGVLLIYLLHLLLRFVEAPASRWLALLLGGFWLLSPMQVSTVLYAVQRMAMLSAGFMLLACICYTRWRIGLFRGRTGWGWPVLCILCFVLALFSKENGILLIPLLWLMEVLWFQCRSESKPVEAALRKTTRVSGWIGVFALGLVLAVAWGTITAGYGHRDFSLPQRLLTEPRILWDYIGQFVWPELTRLGLYHDDIVISTSPAGPSATTVALLGWFVVIGLSLIALRWRWGRYLVLGPAFYLVAHSLESSLWPLELYFEHRNYFPSVGLMLFVAVGLSLLITRWREVRTPVLVYMGLFVFLLATRTSSQVQVWSSTPLLVFNHVIGHPGSYRANADMAMFMSSTGDMETAAVYFQRARETGRTQSAGDHVVLDVILHCLANRDFTQDAAFDGEVSAKALRVKTPAALLTLLELVRDDHCPALNVTRFADAMAGIYLVEGNYLAPEKIYFALAALENKLERYELAYGYIVRYLRLQPGEVTGLLMKLHFATALRREPEVAAVLARLRKLDGAGELTAGQRETMQLYLP